MQAAEAKPKMEIMAMLGHRGDKAALSALLDAVNDESPAVRVAAIGAATRLGGPKGRACASDALGIGQRRRRSSSGQGRATACGWK